MIRIMHHKKVGKNFEISTTFVPAGDQPKAIDMLVRGLRSHLANQLLLGVTGSGKTFTIAHVIATLGKPTIVLAPNKTFGRAALWRI